MDDADRALYRAWELASEDSTDALEAELRDLIPILVKAGYAKEEPWGDDPDWFLWSFTDAGVKRADELESSN
jgi:hypothetical protein